MNKITKITITISEDEEKLTGDAILDCNGRLTPIRVTMDSKNKHWSEAVCDLVYEVGDGIIEMFYEE